MGSDGGHEVIQRSSILHAAGTSHGKQAGNSDFTLGAAASEANLAPLHRTAQCSFGDVIGRLDAFVAQEGEEPLEMLHERKSEIGDVFVGAVEITIRQREKLLLQGNGFCDQLLPCDRTISDTGSVTKTMP